MEQLTKEVVVAGAVQLAVSQSWLFTEYTLWQPYQAS